MITTGAMIIKIHKSRTWRFERKSLVKIIMWKRENPYVEERVCWVAESKSNRWGSDFEQHLLIPNDSSQNDNCKFDTFNFKSKLGEREGGSPEFIILFSRPLHAFFNSPRPSNFHSQCLMSLLQHFQSILSPIMFLLLSELVILRPSSS